MLWVRISIRARCKTLCDQVCQWLVGGFLRVLWFFPPIKLTPRCNWNIVESGVKHHQANRQLYFLQCFWRLISFLLWYISISYNKQHLYQHHIIFLNRHRREQSNNIQCTWQWEDINQHRRYYWMVSNYFSYIATNSINTVRIKCTCSSSIKKNTTKQCKNKEKHRNIR